MHRQPVFLPSRHCIPVPTRINPIWDMDEHARVRLNPRKDRQHRAPNIIPRPGPGSGAPFFVPVEHVAMITRIPYTPPWSGYRTAGREAGAGATGWALGWPDMEREGARLCPEPEQHAAPGYIKQPLSG